MSVMSWFSISTTTSWSKLPVASGDKCPGCAIGAGAAIGTRPDPSSATMTRRIAVTAAPRARLMSTLLFGQRERRGLRPGADAGNPRGESGHQRRERLPTWVAAISGLGAGYREWLLQCGTASSAGTEDERRNDGTPGGATDRTTRFLPLPPLRIPASRSEVSDEPASSGGDPDR